MKSAGWYIVKAGEVIWRETRAEIRKVALKIANETGKPVTVRPGPKVKPEKPKVRFAAAKPKPRTMKRNPDPGSLVDFLYQLERGKAARREKDTRTRPARLAKADRRRGTTPATSTRPAGRFAIDVKNRKEAYSLYRPSRSAADQLADQFRAAGYTANVREA